jgi:hypothetical protein
MDVENPRSVNGPVASNLTRVSKDRLVANNDLV